MLGKGEDRCQFPVPQHPPRRSQAFSFPFSQGMVLSPAGSSGLLKGEPSRRGLAQGSRVSRLPQPPPCQTQRALRMKVTRTYPPGPRDGLWGITFHGRLQAAPLAFLTEMARTYGDFAFVR